MHSETPYVRRLTAPDGTVYIGASENLEAAIQVARIGTALVAAPLLWNAAGNMKPTDRTLVRGLAVAMAAWNGWAWWKVRNVTRT